MNVHKSAPLLLLVFSEWTWICHLINKRNMCYVTNDDDVKKYQRKYGHCNFFIHCCNVMSTTRFSVPPTIFLLIFVIFTRYLFLLAQIKLCWSSFLFSQVRINFSFVFVAAIAIANAERVAGTVDWALGQINCILYLYFWVTRYRF